MQSLQRALEQALQGDRDALALLYASFSDSLLAYLCTQVRRREDAEDLLGQVFLEAVRDLPRFSGDLSGFRAWLFRIATNRAVDLARRRSRRSEEPLDLVAGRPADDDPEAEALARLESSDLRRAVESLPPDQRRVIRLRLAGGLSSSEIARVLGKTPGAVKALQFRALANLSRLLGADARGRREAPPYPDATAGRSSSGTPGVGS